MSASGDSEAVTLRDLWQVLSRGKFKIAGLAGGFLAIGITYVLIAAPWYEATVLLAPAEERSTEDVLSSSLGGLVGLAGISIGGEDSSEAIAILESRDFTRAFISDLNLLPILYADRWNAEARAWKTSDPDEVPDMREAVRYFSEKICQVEEDNTTGLVTLSVTWKDRDQAAQWANELVKRLNAAMRERALTEAQRNYVYLEKELGKASIVTLQQSIGRLLDAELQKLMLARGNDEFAFRVLDRAEAPLRPARPRRILVPALMFLLGGILGVAIVTIRHSIATPAAR